MTHALLCVAGCAADWTAPVLGESSCEKVPHYTKSHVTWQSKVPQPPLAATNRELNYLSVCEHTADQNLTILCIVASNGFSRPCHSMQQHAQLFAATSRQPDGANNRDEPVDNVRICTSLN